jgi:hypothetical protein
MGPGRVALLEPVRQRHDLGPPLRPADRCRSSGRGKPHLVKCHASSPVPLAARQRPADLRRDLAGCESKPSTSGVVTFITTSPAARRPPRLHAQPPVGAPRQRHDRLRPGLAHQPHARPASERSPARSRRRPGEGHHPPCAKAPPFAKGMSPTAPDPPASARQARSAPAAWRPHRPHPPSTCADPFSASDSFIPSNTSPSKARRNPPDPARQRDPTSRPVSDQAALHPRPTRLKGRRHPPPRPATLQRRDLLVPDPRSPPSSPFLRACPERPPPVRPAAPASAAARPHAPA